MGKWSQYRRRGKPRAQSATALGPPPAPVLSIQHDQVIQTATGSDDTGGLIKLYESDDGGLTWYEFDSQAWYSPWSWGPSGDYSGSWLRATEVGNGTNYVGESIPSNELHL